MGDLDNVELRDFLAWVRIRRAIRKDAWVSDEVVEFVAQGVEKFLEGSKNPWPKGRGNKRAIDKMWECFHLTTMAEGDAKLLPQHKDEGGAFSIVGERLRLSPSTVESHVRKAAKMFATHEGQMEYAAWIRRTKGYSGVFFYPKDSPEALAEKARRDRLMSGEFKAK